MHGVRPWGPGRVGRSEGARADLPAARLGGAFADGDLGSDAGGGQGRALQGRPDHRRPGCGRRDQPARDDGRVEQEDRHAGAQRDRVAGHAHRPHLQRARQGRRAGPVPPEGGSSAGHLLLRPEDPLDHRQRARREGAGAERRPGVRQHRQLGRVEPDRRPGRRRACHRPDQRVAHDADEPGDARLGRRDPGHDGRSAGDDARDQVVEHRVREGQGRARRHPGRRDPGRPAGGRVRPDVLLGRRGQEHLRHRQLPPAEHGYRGGAVQERPA